MVPLSSLLLLDKPTGITSFSSLSPVKRYVNKKTGHAGTLDKFAHGLMIVLTGSYTKLNPFFSSLDKSYRAVIELGSQTDTLDPEGEVIAVADPPELGTLKEVITTQFIGEIQQRPPLYSAIHIDGKRAHKLARSGRDYIIPDARPVTIESIDIISYENNLLTLDISCSKGTYIRSLARDIAIAAGSRGYVKELERTRIGPYFLGEAESSTSSELLRKHAEGSIERLNKLPSLSHIVLSDESLQTLSYGRKPTIQEYVSSDIPQGSPYALIHDERGKTVSIALLNSATLIEKNIKLEGVS